MHIGRIKEIWRHPVKSMVGERVEAAQIEAAGFADDRTWAVRDEEIGEFVTGRKIPKLMMLKARYLSEPHGGFGPAAQSRVEIEFPDGRCITSDDPYAAAILSMYTGKQLSLWQRPAARDKAPFRLSKPMSPSETRYVLGMKPDDPDPDFSQFSLKMLATLSKYATPPGVLYDVYPLHFMTTAALDTMNQHYPEGNFCAQRYRPSFVIETPPELSGIAENAWTGRNLRIGDAIIRCNHPTIRCSMPGAAQPGIAHDPKVPLAVMQHAGQHLGAYATPRNHAKINVGDTVELLPQQSGKLFIWFNEVGRRAKSNIINVGNSITDWQEQRGKQAPKAKAAHPRGFRPFTLIKREQESSDITSFWFKDPHRSQLPRFVPGQHIVLALSQADGSSVYRPYSLTSVSHQQDSYRISVKRETETLDGETVVGKASACLHDQLAIGDKLAIKDPSGQFATVPTDTTPLVLISAGIGITPFLAILQSLLKENPNREVQLFHGIRNPDDFAFQDSLNNLQQQLANFRLHLYVSQADAKLPAGSKAGRMSPQELVDTLATHDQHDFMICGKPAFSKAFHDGLLASGIAAERLHFESFGASAKVDDKDKNHYRIHFTESQQSLDWDPSQASLLSFAEEQGIDAASGCRYGACQACEATLLSGQVSYPEDIQPPSGKNKVLLCSARPKSDLELML